MTPMIDVVFLLLVFFVCASIGQKPDALLPAQLNHGTTESKVDPPQEVPDEFPPQEVRIRLARIDGQLRIELNEGIVPGARELRLRLERLAELSAQSKIILDIQDDVSVQQFIAIYDLCQGLGFASISFAINASGFENKG